MVIKVLKSKNDQLRRGDEVVISQLCSPACPVELLKSRVTSHSHMRPAQFFASLCTPRVGSRQSSLNLFGLRYCVIVVKWRKNMVFLTIEPAN